MLERWICKIKGQPVTHFEKIFFVPDLIFLICSYLAPEDIFNLMKLETKFKDILSKGNAEANVFWKQKTEKHFPEKIDLYASSSTNWYEIFIKVYDQYYTKTPIKLRKLFSLVHEKDIVFLKDTIDRLTPIQYDYLPNLLLKRNKEKQFIIQLAKQKTNQAMLDYFFRIMLEYFNKKNIPINGEDKQGNNLLHWAIYCRQPITVINKLIAAKVSIEDIDSYSRSPLFLAAEDGLDDIVKGLLAAYANINDNDVCIAAKNGHYKVVETLLNNGANVNAIYNAYQGQYESAIYLATQNGHTDIVKLFLGWQADVNIIGQQLNENNGTALHIAISNGHRQLAKLLLDYPQTNLDAQTSFGTTALILAIAKQDIELVHLLLLKNVNVSQNVAFSGRISGFYLRADSHAFHLAAAVGNLMIIKFLYEKTPHLLLIANKAGQLPSDLAHYKIKDEIELLEYAVRRPQETEFIYSFNLFQSKITFTFPNRSKSGYSKDEKIAAANYIIGLIFNENKSADELDQYLPALTNGRLGKIFTNLRNKYPLLKSSENSTGNLVEDELKLLFENEPITYIKKLFTCF